VLQFSDYCQWRLTAEKWRTTY